MNVFKRLREKIESRRMKIDARNSFMVDKEKLRLELKDVEKLNVGCGRDLLKGWLNIGLFSEERIPYGATKRENGALILHFDMTDELPICEDSIKYVYASHFIEHLTFQDGIKMLERCYTIMKRGGVIRLVFPDMELWIKNYYENKIEFFEKYKSMVLSGYLPLAVTKGEIFMSQVHNFDHKWCYDFESIKHILEKTGFSQVTKRKAFESLIPDIDEVELDNKLRLLESCYVEAVK